MNCLSNMLIKTEEVFSGEYVEDVGDASEIGDESSWNTIVISASFNGPRHDYIWLPRVVCAGCQRCHYENNTPIIYQSKFAAIIIFI